MAPLLEALNQQYLGADAKFGCVDQKEMFDFTTKYMPQLGYQNKIQLLSPTATPISATDADAKIDILDDEKTVKKKISKAFCEEGNIEHNGLLSFAKNVLYPLLDGKSFVIERPEQYGGNVSFASYEAMEKAFGSRDLDPVDLKAGVTAQLNQLLDPIRTNAKLAPLATKAYPDGDKSAKAAKAPKEAKAAKAPKEAKGDAGKKGESKERKKFTPEEVAAMKAKSGKDKPAKDKKPEAAPAAAKKAAPAAGDWNVSHLNIIVGTILKAWPHPESDKLWCESIDVGEAEPRQIASGLRAFYPDEKDFTNRKVLVLANLKARKLAGFPSNGMVLCASNADHTKVTFADVPAGAVNGERVSFEGFEGDAATPAQMEKKKVCEKVFPGLVVGEDGTCAYNGVPFKTSAGNCTAPKEMAGSHIA